MTPSGGLDAAAELAKLDAEHRDRVAAIRAEAEELRRERREFRSHLGATPVEYARSRALGQRLITEKEIDEGEDKRIREADDRYDRAVHALERRVQLLRAAAALQPDESEPTEPNTTLGMNYAGEGVEEVVTRATAAQQQGIRLARSLRDQLAAEVGVTEYEVDMIFRLMKRKKLAAAGRGCLTVDGHEQPTPRFINLHALETGSES